MTDYFASIRDLPTVEVTAFDNYAIKSGGMLAKLLSSNDGKAQVLFYAPDLGYPVRGEGGLVDHSDYITQVIPEGHVKPVPALNSLDQFVRQSMLTFPSIFPSREDVLVHSYLVLGNGMEWNARGQLSDRTGAAKPERPDMELEGETYETWSMRDFYERMKDFHDEEGYLEKQFAVDLENIKGTNAIRRHRDLFIDYYATTRSRYNLKPGHYENAVAVNNYIATNSTLSSIPARVDPHFLDGAVEILKKVISSTPHGFGYSARNDAPAEKVPSWLKAHADALKQEQDEDRADAEKENVADVHSACRNLNYFINQLKNKRAKIGWSYENEVVRNLVEIGFKEKADLHSTNGSGSVMVWRGKVVTTEQIETLATDLEKHGFIRDGLRFQHEVWSVRFELFPEAKKHRAQIMIITHPEDEKRLIDILERVWKDCWADYQKWNANQRAKQKDKREAKARGENV